MPQKGRNKSNKKKSKSNRRRGASNTTAASTAAEAVPSPTTPPRANRGEDVGALASWIENGGDTPAQVIRNKEASRDAADEEHVLHPGGSVLLPDDDVGFGQVYAWIETDGDISAGRLANLLPLTAQGLRNGEVAPLDFAKELCKRVVARSEAKSEQREGCIFDANSGLRVFTTDMANHIVLPTTNKSLYDEVFIDMHFSLRRAVLKASETDEWKEAAPAAFTRAAKQAFNDTCSEWEERLDARLGQPTGTCRQECTLLGAQLEDGYPGETSPDEIFDGFVWDATRMDGEVVAAQLFRWLHLSAIEIREGIDNGYITCWECGKTAKTTDYCSGCKAAQYCGLECQLKAWKDGHKTACPVLAAKLECFRASLAAVDQAHRTGMLEGVRLCQYLDYKQLFPMHCVTDNLIEFAEDLGLPSMKFYYKNLARVLRGEWWLYSESETPPTKEFEEASRLNVGNCSLEVEFEYFTELTMFLAYDYFGCAARVHGVKDPKKVTALFEEESCLTESAECFGAAMPRSVFLEKYQQMQPCPSMRLETYRTKERKVVKFWAYKHLREEYHKTSLTGEVTELPIG